MFYFIQPFTLLIYNAYKKRVTNLLSATEKFKYPCTNSITSILQSKKQKKYVAQMIFRSKTIFKNLHYAIQKFRSTTT
jgi:hypothetical protein